MNQTMYETIINCIFVFMKKMVIPVNTDVVVIVNNTLSSSSKALYSSGRTVSKKKYAIPLKGICLRYRINKNAKMNQTVYETIINCIFCFYEENGHSCEH